MSENASVSRQYLNQIRHYQCTLNEGSKKNTGHLTPCWIREAQLYEKAKVLGQMLHCSKCWYAYGTGRGKRLQRQAGKAPVTGSSSALLADKPETHQTAHSGDTTGGCPRGGSLLTERQASMLHSVWAPPCWQPRLQLDWWSLRALRGPCEEANGHTLLFRG